MWEVVGAVSLGDYYIIPNNKNTVALDTDDRYGRPQIASFGKCDIIAVILIP